MPRAKFFCLMLNRKKATKKKHLEPIVLMIAINTFVPFRVYKNPALAYGRCLCSCLCFSPTDVKHVYVMAAQWDIHTLHTGDRKQVHEHGIDGRLEPSLSLELQS